MLATFMRDIMFALVGLFLGTVIAILLGHLIFATYFKPDLVSFKENLYKENPVYFKK
jgi:hypothetical protein